MKGQFIESVSRRPLRALRPFVSGYQGSGAFGFAPGRHITLPGSSLTVVISLAEPLLIQSGASADAAIHSAVLGGLRTMPSTVVHDGSSFDISFNLTPFGAALFGIAAVEVAGVIVDLSDVWGRRSDALVERLRDARSWEDRFEILDHELSLQIDAGLVADPALAEAWHLIKGSGGRIRVDQVADGVGYSRRHLHHRFVHEFGITPKQACRLVRFNRSVLILKREERRRRRSVDTTAVSLAEVALASGYADQAHMTREWNDFAGCSPTRWVATEELSFVQDTA